MRLKGRCLNLFEYEYIYYLPFFHMASSIMPFSLPSSLENVVVAVTEGH
jgi:hypothetical protein